MKHFLKHNGGASVPAYGILVGLVSIASMGAIITSGQSLEDIYDTTACYISNSDSCAGLSDGADNANGNAAPEITTTAIPNGMVDVEYNYTFTVEDEDPDTVTWQLNAIDANGIPDGVTFDPATGTLSGTPTTYQDHMFQVTATDADGAMDITILPMLVRDGLRKLTEGADGIANSRLATQVYVKDNVAYLANDISGTGHITAFDMSTGDVIRTFTPTTTPSNYAKLGAAMLAKNGKLYVGSRNDYTADRSTRPGTVYVFDIETGQQIDQIDPVDPEPTDSFDFSASRTGTFGDALTDAGDFLLVHASGTKAGGLNLSGAIYAYRFDTHEVVSVIFSPEPMNYGYFGRSGAVYGNFLFTGEERYNSQDNTSLGTVFVYDISDLGSVKNKNNPEAQIVPGTSGNAVNNGMYYGQKIEISGNTLAVNAWGRAFDGVSKAGSVYLYDVTSPMSPVLQNIIGSSSPATNDRYGYNMTMSNSHLLITSLDPDGTEFDSGYVDAYKLSDGSFVKRLTPFDNFDNSKYSAGYGEAMSSDGENILIGAPLGHYTEDDNIVLSNSGSAFVVDDNLNEIAWSQERNAAD